MQPVEASGERQKCQHYVARKRRFCKFPAMPGQKYCGNHFVTTEGYTGPARVQCPYDPTGDHTVLVSDLEKHKAKCPALRLLREQQAQPCYREGINAGSGPGAVLPEASPEHADRRGRTDTDTARRAAYAASLGPEGFAELLSRIDRAHEQLCGPQPEPLHALLPPEAQPFMRPEANRPYSVKHASQQASIIGNMRRAGLLRNLRETVYVEFGAGKGYLSSMLADCSGVGRLVMMDRRGFKTKADRGMRHLSMQRLRCDIADFDAAGVECLRGGREPWVAIGKHLCGAATDFTLRCCARESRRRGAGVATEQAQRGCAGGGAAPSPTAAGVPGQRAAVPAAAAGSSEAAAAATEECHPAERDGRSGECGAGLQGLAVATCCHHRCSWRHYVGQEVLRGAGFSPEDFELLSWMTGWALCGHEAPAGCGADGEGTGVSGTDTEEDEQEGNKVGAQRQRSTAGTAQLAAGVAAGQHPTPASAHKQQQQQQQGREASGEDPGCGSTNGKLLGLERLVLPTEVALAGGPGAAGEQQGRAKRLHLDGEQLPKEQRSAAAMAPAASGGEALAGTEPTCRATGSGAAADMHSRAATEQQQQHGGDGGEEAWRPHHALGRAERMAVGHKCKRLIDYGRMLWLQQQGFKAELVAYVPPEVSGENRLLLART
ncbi:hypothetical protein N2152v2_004588 [Parachlorella kessleri]